MSGLLLAVDARIDRFLSGAATGFSDAINIPTLKITQPDPDQVVRTSYMRSTVGQALDTYNRPKPAEIEFETDECAPDILSMAFLGRPAAYSQAEGTDQPVTFTSILNKWVAIGKNNLTKFTYTGKVAGTDYEIDLEAGLFKLLAGTAGSVAATASYPARSGHTIVAGTDTTLQVSMIGTGINLFNSQHLFLEIFQANISPSSGIDFISSDPVKLTFKGTLVTPTGKAGPYQLTVHS